MKHAYAGEMQMRAHSGPGIYAIINRVTSKRYVGSATNVRSRWNKHRRTLHEGTHHSVLLQRAWNKHGSDVFDFVLLEVIVDRQQLIKAEQRYMDLHESHNPSLGYNIAPRAGSSLGVKQSAEACEKQRRRYPNRRGEHHTDESRAKMSVSQKVRVKGRARSEECRKKISESALGRVISIEQRAKIAASLRGRKCSTEAIEKAAAATRGLKRSDETKRRMSESIKKAKMLATLAQVQWIFYGT